MHKAAIHYVVLAPGSYHIDGEDVRLEPGHILDADIVERWPGAVVDRLLDLKKLAAMPVPSDEWLLEQVAKRGLAGSGGVVGGRAAAAAHPDIDSEQEDEQGRWDDNGGAHHDRHPKHVGNGVYELSNGEQVKGKAAAMQAQAALEE